VNCSGVAGGKKTNTRFAWRRGTLRYFSCGNRF
jgi:hypothetical protein